MNVQPANPCNELISGKRTDLLAAVRITSPAVRNEPLSGGFLIDGASGSENTFIIDGLEVANFRDGTLNSNNSIPVVKSIPAA